MTELNPYAPIQKERVEGSLVVAPHRRYADEVYDPLWHWDSSLIYHVAGSTLRLDRFRSEPNQGRLLHPPSRKPSHAR
jgi:hypothetical protein